MTKYSQYKDYIFRQKAQKAQFNNYLLKSFLLNSKVKKWFRFKIMLKLQKTNYNNIWRNKYINRCMFSTKVRAVSRLTNLTKATMKANLMGGNITGFKKASW